MTQTGEDDIIEWKKEPVRTNEQESQTVILNYEESHTQTDEMKLINQHQQTIEKILSESECQTDPDNQHFEVGTQTQLDTKDQKQQTIERKPETIATQTDMNRYLTNTDCQTDEIVIKEKNEVEIETKTVHTQTLKTKPQQRTVGFQIDESLEFKK